MLEEIRDDDKKWNDDKEMRTMTRNDTTPPKKEPTNLNFKKTRNLPRAQKPERGVIVPMTKLGYSDQQTPLCPT
jgi:hypothetical protein